MYGEKFGRGKNARWIPSPLMGGRSITSFPKMLRAAFQRILEAAFPRHMARSHALASRVKAEGRGEGEQKSQLTPHPHLPPQGGKEAIRTANNVLSDFGSFLVDVPPLNLRQ